RRPGTGAGTRGPRLRLGPRPDRAGSRRLMGALLDSLAAGFDSAAPWRREALDAALRDGLPLARSEAWKYTALRALDRRSFAPVPAQAAPAFDAEVLEGIPAPRLVFVNGRFDGAHSDTTGLPAGARLQRLPEILADNAARKSRRL